MEIDLTNAHPCPDCRQCLTILPKCRYCAERDQLRSTVAGLRGPMQVYFDGYMQDEAEDAEDCVDGERQHLAALAVKTALAASPDEHARRLKAEALREAAGELAPGIDAVDYLLAEADRLEAANG